MLDMFWHQSQKFAPAYEELISNLTFKFGKLVVKDFKQLFKADKKLNLTLQQKEFEAFLADGNQSVSDKS